MIEDAFSQVDLNTPSITELKAEEVQGWMGRRLEACIEAIQEELTVKEGDARAR